MKTHLITHNASMLTRWEEDPLRAICKDIHVGTGVTLMDGEEFIATLNVTWPFLLSTGDDDIACDSRAGIEFYNRARTPIGPRGKQLQIYPGMRHTLRWDPGSDKVKADAIAYFRSFVKN